MHRRTLFTSAGAAAFVAVAPGFSRADTTDILPLSAPVHIAIVGLRTRDAETLADWYRRHVGLEETGRDGSRIWLGAGGIPLLELIEQPGLQLAPVLAAGLYHTAFLLPSRADLADWVLAAAAGRYPVDGASDHAVSEAFYLTDPEGNGVEIYADRPARDWRWTGGQVQMGSAAIDFDALLANARPGAAFTSAPAGTCIGHVHLKVGAVQAAADWWTGRIGLDLVRARDGAAFLSTGGYHHHIAVNSWDSAGAGPRADRQTGLAFVELRSRRPVQAQTLQDPWGSEIRLTRQG